MAEMKESVLTFGPAGALVGVLTQPPAQAPGGAKGIAVIFLNAGVIHRVGPYRLHVQLARTLAAGGTPCLRMDLPGIGDSRPLGTGGNLDEEWVSGARTAMDVLEGRGVASRFVLFGLCAGADRAFMTALADTRVVGVALVDPTGIFPTWQSKLLRVARGLTRPSSWMRLLAGRYRLVEQAGQWLRSRWAGPTAGPAGKPAGVQMTPEGARRMAEGALRTLVQRGVRMCYVITASQEHRYNYKRQLFHAFPGMGLEELVQVELFSASQHTLPRDEDRRMLQETVADWLERSFPGGAEPEPGGEDSAELEAAGVDGASGLRAG